jgi:hypothetical protein
MGCFPQTARRQRAGRRQTARRARPIRRRFPLVAGARFSSSERSRGPHDDDDDDDDDEEDWDRSVRSRQLSSIQPIMPTPTTPTLDRLMSRGRSTSIGVRGARANVDDALVGKAELLTFARERCEATGKAANASANASEWSALKTGVAALACARWAYPESFDACAVIAGVSGSKHADEATRDERFVKAARAPWDTVRRIFAREKVPTASMSFEKMALGTDFQSLHDAFAVLYWQYSMRTRDAGRENFVVSFSRKLDPALAAYCKSRETQERTLRLVRRAAMVKSPKPTVLIVDEPKPPPSVSDEAQSEEKKDVAVEEDVEEAMELENAPPAVVESKRTLNGDSAQSEGSSMSIDQWESITEIRWELEKTKEALEERERDLEKLRESSPRATRILEMKVRDLTEQLALEHEERVKMVRKFDSELKLLQSQIADVMSKTVLSENNMEVFNAVDISTEEGRVVAQKIIDTMDRVRKARSGDQEPVLPRSALSPSADTSDDVSQTFLSRLDSLELSEDSNIIHTTLQTSSRRGGESNSSMLDELLSEEDDEEEKEKEEHVAK